MPSKMYILVETDQSHADPLSRLMTQLVDQLKVKPTNVTDNSLFSTHNDEILSSTTRAPNISEKDSSMTSTFHTVGQPHYSSNAHSSLDHPHNEVHIKCRPTPNSEKSKALHPDDIRAAITAEACVDSNGLVKAKVWVTNNRASEETSIISQNCNKDTSVKTDFSFYEKRNGLDPTLAELRGHKKFEYLPLKTKIPEYKGNGKCDNVKPIAISDHLSSSSMASTYAGFRSKRHSSIIAGSGPNCAKNIPEARLNKYKACIARRNGLQDKCDAVSRITLKNCHKSMKC